MDSYRTPLAQARGLGSAKHGAGHWISERVSSVALVPLSLWGVYAVLKLAGTDYVGAAAWIAHPLNATLMALLAVVSFQHMHAGMRVIVEDYFEGAQRAVILLGNLFVCVLLGALAVFSILKVALGGA
ncbi:succinate dehydrogenase, hydrophobic membrane anchor protein [Phenylobacterium sp.]|jgi:succinate dehydrogenase / fumarate reductase membrane anchor subunit|uniref:succinate dehydrogenase, hydrophobic membrane anchor protein n=1 Tax=Phenylobacterium sp. TaxID=1871053 RepID=UPI002F40B7EA